MNMGVFLMKEETIGAHKGDQQKLVHCPLLNGNVPKMSHILKLPTTNLVSLNIACPYGPSFLTILCLSQTVDSLLVTYAFVQN